MPDQPRSAILGHHLNPDLFTVTVFAHAPAGLDLINQIHAAPSWPFGVELPNDRMDH